MSIVTPSPAKSYRQAEANQHTLGALNLRSPRYQDKSELQVNKKVRQSLEEIISRKLFTNLVTSISSSQEDHKDNEETLRTQLSSVIAVEVKKMLTSTHFVSQQQLVDLESKIKYELYLKEKKMAILQDRKEGNEDTISHLSRVQGKLRQSDDKDHKSYQSSLLSKQEQ